MRYWQNTCDTNLWQLVVTKTESIAMHSMYNSNISIGSFLTVATLVSILDFQLH